MLFKKQGFPEESDLVLCTVTSVQFHSVFVDLDEYGKGGMIHISEVSPGRIRNIRDFVKEGKKIVCKVLRINLEKGYIDLSLRRVNESEKRRKIDEIKKEQNSEKIVEIAAAKLGLKTNELYKEILEKTIKSYSSLHQFFEDASKDGKVIESMDIDKKYSKVLEEIIKQRIKPSEVEVKGKLKLATFAPNGIELIKECLKKAEESAKGRVSINYLGSGTYRFMIKANDYKEAEKLMKAATEGAIGFFTKHDGTAEFSRESE
ncbi:translation initiation factor IF-2 subunit alpha [Candidatus Woesearchaeota archaeon]|nr:translation initiation factor IF-2 subunit alpha [Candidatus Woesearchaeota archaeon]